MRILYRGTTYLSNRQHYTKAAKMFRPKIKNRSHKALTTASAMDERAGTMEPDRRFTAARILREPGMDSSRAGWPLNVRRMARRTVLAVMMTVCLRCGLIDGERAVQCVSYRNPPLLAWPCRALQAESKWFCGVGQSASVKVISRVCIPFSVRYSIIPCVGCS